MDKGVDVLVPPKDRTELNGGMLFTIYKYSVLVPKPGNIESPG